MAAGSRERLEHGIQIPAWSLNMGYRDRLSYFPSLQPDNTFNYVNIAAQETKHPLLTC